MLSRCARAGSTSAIAIASPLPGGGPGQQDAVRVEDQRGAEPLAAALRAAAVGQDQVDAVDVGCRHRHHDIEVRQAVPARGTR